MERLEKIKSDIEQLSPEEFQELKKWILQKDWEMWDKQIEKDSESGKLDFLIEQAEEGSWKDNLKDL
jgi:hypothetical protein